MALAINPETKVGQVLDAYPGIEETLIALAPAFAKLRNPVLRRTVAKVATLEQAARIGGIGVKDLVLKLRAAVGQIGGEIACAGAAAKGEPEPEWVRNGSVARHLDAEAILASGGNPIGRVRQCLAEVRKGDILRLTSSFRPAPLIDMLVRDGILVYCEEVAPGEFATYMHR